MTVTTVPSALPSGSLLLHIGPQKTGSTALQLAMHRARAELVAHGVHVVGEHTVEREAGWVALGLGSPIGRPPPRAEAWQRVVEEIRTSTLPRLCLSNEDFGRADDAAVARILDATGAERTHVVFVARRLDKLLPSHWQERVKARSTLSYPDFLREMLAPEPTGWNAQLLWGPLDIPAVVERWSRHLDRDRIIVLVSDEDDRTTTTAAFEALLGLPPGLLVAPSLPANRSLGVVEAETVRRLNRVSLEEQWTAREYRNVIQAGVVKALKRRPAAGPSLGGVPAWAFDRVAELADAQVRAVTEAGVRVIGDPELLRVRDHAEPVDQPAEVAEVPLDLLADVVSGARAGYARLHDADLHRAEREARAESVAARRNSLGVRELVQLLARRTAARLGVTSR